MSVEVSAWSVEEKPRVLRHLPRVLRRSQASCVEDMRLLIVHIIDDYFQLSVSIHTFTVFVQT